MPKKIDEDFLKSQVGKEFGFLTVIEYKGRKEFAGVNRPYFSLVCCCGEVIERNWNALSTSNTKSCGCTVLDRDGNPKLVEKHGMTHTPTYFSWQNMLARCERKTSEKFNNYGARGIKICEEWRTSFLRFLEDMGEKPDYGYSIERKDVNGDYCKENCIWTNDARLQAFNQTRSKKNKSGRTGVRQLASGKWIACIGSNVNRQWLGTFETFESAVQARERAELEIFGFIKE